MPLFLNLSCALHYEELMNWRRDGLVVWKPVRALLFAKEGVLLDQGSSDCLSTRWLPWPG